jgi:hypothetical protein
MKKQKTLKEATIIELKAAAFDINNQIKNLNNQYNLIIEELGERDNAVEPSEPSEPSE